MQKNHFIIHRFSNELRIFKKLSKTFSSGIKLLQIEEAEAEARREKRISKSHDTCAGQTSVTSYGNLLLAGGAGSPHPQK
jgi:hypothetical protein